MMLHQGSRNKVMWLESATLWLKQRVPYNCAMCTCWIGRIAFDQLLVLGLPTFQTFIPIHTCKRMDLFSWRCTSPLSTWWYHKKSSFYIEVPITAFHSQLHCVVNVFISSDWITEKWDQYARSQGANLNLGIYIWENLLEELLLANWVMDHGWDCLNV